ncbi:MAG: DUF4440 domain-containing protein [Streptosporangiales bacterium]|nr:DUF4440 domain-containing protein [Streptosporangiales bacterium]
MNNQNDGIAAFLSEWAAAELNEDTAFLEGCLMLSKQDWLARYAGGLKYEAFELEDVRVRRYGDAAVVVALLQQKGTHQGNPIPTSTRASLVLVNGPGTWRLAGIQFSFVAGTPGAPPIPGRG